ncbi:MAG: hypothetical protein M3619_00715 [Myxococcota bacterium]|nr:hypothetical protein [Myxococcota bacterium]
MTTASHADAVRFLGLLASPGDVFELRGLSKGRAMPQVTAGYFDNMAALADAAVARSGKDDGVYVTINPVLPALLARAPANRVRQAGNGDTTSDRDVRARRRILVDVDPVRPTGISSTEAEHAGAIALATRIADDLHELGWPEPVRADSGNGGHLIYAIDLPVDDGGLVKRVLAELSRRYTTPEHKVDEKVFNPARISKLYGTLTRKGEDTEDRPHRLSRILRAPAALVAVTRGQLEALAPSTPQKTAPIRGSNGSHEPQRFDIDVWLAEHIPDAISQPWSEGRKWLLPVCPFNSDHSRREAYITEKASGSLAAGCQHESCFKSWRDLRLHFEPHAYDRAPGNGALNGHGQRLSDRTPPPEVLYRDSSYRDDPDVEAFAARDREDATIPTATLRADEPLQVRLISIREAMEDLATLATMPRYPTPFPRLNEALGRGIDGLLGSQVYTVCAGTGRGKTTFVAAIAAHTASTGVPVIVATYEMKPGYFVARSAAGKLSRHSNDILLGVVGIEEVINVMPYPELYLMRKPSLRELRAAVEQLKKKYGIAPLVIVDYLQKLADEIASRQARPDLRMATTEASATLLDIGETTGAAIVAVSSIGRGKGKALANPRKFAPYELVEVAKESGAVEYDGAGLIVLTLSDQMEGDERVGTITVAKSRFGREVHIEARYHGARGTWQDCGLVDGPPTTAADIDAACRATPRLRDVILEKVRSGKFTSSNEIQKQIGGNRNAVLAEIAAMQKSKNGAPPILVKVGRAFVVAEDTIEPPAPHVQGLIRAVESEAESAAESDLDQPVSMGAE